jgi:DNA-binding NarL/FixJ family response regulator
MARVLIVDDHEIVREGLALMLAQNPGIKIVGQAKDGMEAVALCERLKPDIVVMDIAMPLLNGIDAAGQITEKFSHIDVIVMSMYDDDATVMRALKAGISGFVLKSGSVNELVQAIYSVKRNKSYFSPKISAAASIFARKNNKSRRRGLDLLTMKEKHILQLIAEGYSSKEIATLLNVSFHTVKTHRNNIMEKLDLRNAAALTRYALQNRLIIYQ